MGLARGGELSAALQTSRGALLANGVFSFVLNLLMLTGPLFMLQVYDRVLTSRSVPTLVALSILVMALYALTGLIELVRSRVLVRVGLAFDDQTSARVFDASSRLGLAKGRASAQHMRDYDALRQFISGPGPGIAFDLPWAPIFLAILFMFHWVLGTVAAIGVVVLFSLAVITDRVSQSGTAEAMAVARRAGDLADAGHTNAEVLAAMGMLGNFRRRWQEANRQSLHGQSVTSDRIGILSAISKTLRLLLQSMMLAIGAYLAIHGLVSMGAIVASSIILGRALAPVEQAIAQWRSFVRARQAYASLQDLLNALPPPTDKIELPAPNGQIDVKNLRMGPPGGQRLTLANLTFAVQPGQMLGVVGPSASGKSSLVRALVGVWPVSGGEIRIDGAKLEHWDQERLGRHIGYVPQDVELFSGTVRDNIARFDADAADEDVIAAARLARAHEMILELPQGYDTELGAFGCHLSAGQKQRVAFARALYGDPQILVLDEPNANLDSAGDAALVAALAELKQRQRTIIVVTHRTSAIASADLILVLEQGQQRAFGTREEVMRKLNQGPAPGTPSPNGPGNTGPSPKGPGNMGPSPKGPGNTAPSPKGPSPTGPAPASPIAAATQGQRGRGTPLVATPPAHRAPAALQPQSRPGGVGVLEPIVAGANVATRGLAVGEGIPQQVGSAAGGASAATHVFAGAPLPVPRPAPNVSIVGNAPRPPPLPRTQE